MGNNETPTDAMALKIKEWLMVLKIIRLGNKIKSVTKKLKRKILIVSFFQKNKAIMTSNKTMTNISSIINLKMNISLEIIIKPIFV
jgi:hypothetical protein